MRHILKSSIALALGAIVALGALSSSSTMAGTPLRGASQSETTPPLVLVRGGIRYQDLQDSRDLNENGGLGFWQRETDDAWSNGLGTWERGGRSMQVY